MAANKIWSYLEVFEKMEMGVCFICDKLITEENHYQSAHKKVQFLWFENEEEPEPENADIGNTTFQDEIVADLDHELVPLMSGDYIVTDSAQARVEGDSILQNDGEQIEMVQVTTNSVIHFPTLEMFSDLIPKIPIGANFTPYVIYGLVPLKKALSNLVPFAESEPHLFPLPEPPDRRLLTASMVEQLTPPNTLPPPPEPPDQIRERIAVKFQVTREPVLLFPQLDVDIQNEVSIFYSIGSYGVEEIKLMDQGNVPSAATVDDWHFLCGTKEYKALKEQFHLVSTTFLDYGKNNQVASKATQMNAGQNDPRFNAFISAGGNKFVTLYVELCDNFVTRKKNDLFAELDLFIDLGLIMVWAYYLLNGKWAHGETQNLSMEKEIRRDIRATILMRTLWVVKCHSFNNTWEAASASVLDRGTMPIDAHIRGMVLGLVSGSTYTKFSCQSGVDFAIDTTIIGVDLGKSLCEVGVAMVPLIFRGGEYFQDVVIAFFYLPQGYDVSVTSYPQVASTNEVVFLFIAICFPGVKQDLMSYVCYFPSDLEYGMIFDIYVKSILIDKYFNNGGVKMTNNTFQLVTLIGLVVCISIILSHVLNKLSIRLESHFLAQEDVFVSSGAEKNAVRTSLEYITAPSDDMFSNDDPLVPSGFCIIPIVPTFHAKGSLPPRPKHLEPDVVLHRKMIYRGSVLARRPLIKWKILPPKHGTYDYSSLRTRMF